MKFSAILFSAVCGAFLVTGGTLIGSDTTRGIGYVFWAGGALLILHSAIRFGVDAWQEWRTRRYIRGLRERNPNPAPRFVPGSGLR